MSKFNCDGDKLQADQNTEQSKTGFRLHITEFHIQNIPVLKYRKCMSFPLGS